MRSALAMIACLFVGPVATAGGNCLYVHAVPDPTSSVMRAACRDAGLAFDELDYLPADLSPYEVLVVHVNSFRDWGTPLCDFVEVGGGLMTIGATPYFVGMPPCIGASSYVNSGGQARVVLGILRTPIPGVHQGDIIQSSNNADPDFGCAAAGLAGLAPTARLIAQWEPNPNGPSCGTAVHALSNRYGDGLHVYLGDTWQYSAVRGMVSLLI